MAEINLEILHSQIYKAIENEFVKDPYSFGIIDVYIPLEGPIPYIDKRCKEIREKIECTLRKDLLKNYTGKSRLLLLKIMKLEVDKIIVDLRRSSIKNHFSNWFVQDTLYRQTNQ